VKNGWRPVLAGRQEDKVRPIAKRLGLDYRVFDLTDPETIASQLSGMKLVMHCAGPFSATSAPMLAACLEAGADYLDVTGEIAVFEHAHGLADDIRRAGIVACPGVGFDVIPTDCVAAALHRALPDATQLALGFDTASHMSPGTAKTAIEWMGMSGQARRRHQIITVPQAWKIRRINFGAGTKTAMTIPWGDVSTAWHTTGIPDIEVYLPVPLPLLAGAKSANYLGPLLRSHFVQRTLKKLVDRFVTGPDEHQRAASCTHVWGEARNAQGVTVTARVRTAHVYELTVTGAMAMIERLLEDRPLPGCYTPGRLMGPEFVCTLEGSGPMEISRD
ncbi:MAG: saccharopine dehydrogenase NADP-binding domain-containing protein, partial [Moraxellaceae bacterium]|nr:saccharopine dehydrogenase NADP-binding domain-containing protein [Moraxellaceae bacterium]